MNVIFNKINKLIANKNTLTILVVIAGIVLIWLVYNNRINSAIKPVTIIYLRQKEPLTAGTQITSDMIGTIKVSSDFLKTAKVYRTISSVEGKYVAENCSIPVGGLFYQELISDQRTDFRDSVEDGLRIAQISSNINLKTTYGNSIMPGSYIDIYAKYTDNGTNYYGKFITSIQVLAVRDSRIKDVFAQSPYGTPAIMYFAVNEDLFNLFEKAAMANVTLYPIPRGKEYSENPSDMVVSKQIINYINANIQSS